MRREQVFHMEGKGSIKASDMLSGCFGEAIAFHQKLRDSTTVGQYLESVYHLYVRLNNIKDILTTAGAKVLDVKVGGNSLHEFAAACGCSEVARLYAGTKEGIKIIFYKALDGFFETLNKSIELPNCHLFFTESLVRKRPSDEKIQIRSMIAQDFPGLFAFLFTKSTDQVSNYFIENYGDAEANRGANIMVCTAILLGAPHYSKRDAEREYALVRILSRFFSKCPLEGAPKDPRSPKEVTLIAEAAKANFEQFKKCCSNASKFVRSDLFLMSLSKEASPYTGDYETNVIHFLGEHGRRLTETINSAIEHTIEFLCEARDRRLEITDDTVDAFIEKKKRVVKLTSRLDSEAEAKSSASAVPQVRGQQAQKPQQSDEWASLLNGIPKQKSVKFSGEEGEKPKKSSRGKGRR